MTSSDKKPRKNSNQYHIDNMLALAKEHGYWSQEVADYVAANLINNVSYNRYNCIQSKVLGTVKNGLLQSNV